MQISWRIVGLVGFGLSLATGLVWLVGGFLTYPMPDNVPTRWDHYRYIAISQHPFASDDPLAREAPYCWRILTPLLVYLSPLAWPVSFMLLTLLGLGGAALTLYSYLRKLGYSEQAGIFGLALFFSLAGLLFNIRDFYLTDPLALFAITLGFYWFEVVRQRGRINLASGLGLLAILVVGVLTKETVLALLPLLILARELNWRTKLGLGLGPVLLIIGLRLAFPSSNAYSYLDEMKDVISNKFFGVGITSLLIRFNFAFLGTWGPALVLLFYRPRQTITYFVNRKAALIYLVIIYSQIFVAHNIDRLLVYGFMVVIPLLVDKAVQLCAERKLKLYVLLGITVSLQLAYFYGRPPLWASLGVCGLLILWLLRPPQLFKPGKFFTPEETEIDKVMSQK